MLHTDGDIANVPGPLLYLYLIQGGPAEPCASTSALESTPQISQDVLSRLKRCDLASPTTPLQWMRMALSSGALFGAGIPNPESSLRSRSSVVPWFSLWSAPGRLHLRVRALCARMVG